MMRIDRFMLLMLAGGLLGGMIGSSVTVLCMAIFRRT